ncbi:hypothetical protein O3P69_006949, partial [Scylla paramamosain]
MASTTPSIKAQADSTTTQQPTTDEKVRAASAAAFDRFSRGKRHLLVGDFKSAVAAFEEATESLVELCGEQAPECGDAYCRCGRALLELTVTRAMGASVCWCKLGACRETPWCSRRLPHPLPPALPHPDTMAQQRRHSTCYMTLADALLTWQR